MEKFTELDAILVKMKHDAETWNIAEIMKLYSKDVWAVEFGTICDYETIQQNCIQGYAQVKGSFKYDFEVIRKVIGDGFACVYGIENIAGENQDGPFNEQINATYVFEKKNGTWEITHHHLSQNKSE